LQGNDHDVAFAPDGSFVVYRTISEGSPMQSSLMLRALNELVPRPLPGTNSARYPFISPDGRWVGFFVGSDLRKVAVGGGSPVLICRTGGGTARGASWGDDDVIVLATAESTGLVRVSANGGELTPFTKGDPEQREVHGYPYVLPGSKTVLFTSYSDNDFLVAHIEAIDVATGARKTVIQTGTDPSYASGYLMYATVNASTDAQSRFRASLRAVRFDLSRVETVGESVAAFEGISVGVTAAANYALSRRGDVVFVPGGLNALDAAPPRSLVWVDRKGKETPIAAPTRGYAIPRISPDGTRIALDIRDQTNDIWIWDISRQTLTSLNRNPAQDMSPVWTPDSRRVVWTTTRTGGNPNLFWQPADGTGTPERLTTHPSNQFPTSITPDGGTILLFGSGGSAANAADLFTVGVSEPEHKAKALVSAAGFDFDPEISPDGKWLAYHSNESGEFQVYVRPFPDVQAGRWQISTNGGTRATWARNGRELFYLDKDGFLTSAPVLPPIGTAFAAGPAAKILNAKYYLGSSVLGLDLRGYDVSADGQRFLMIKDLTDLGGTSQLASMVFVLNWVEEMKARLPAQ
jgi:serine/threonine-protein kinase